MDQPLLSVPAPAHAGIVGLEPVRVGGDSNDAIAMIESDRDDTESACRPESRTDEARSESGEVSFQGGPHSIILTDA